jgi:hypothetical protein
MSTAHTLKRSREVVAYGDNGTTSHMLKKSVLSKDVAIRATNAEVQTASSQDRLIPLGRADVGTTYKGAILFENHKLAANLISIPRLDTEGCKIVVENSKMVVSKRGKTIMSGMKEEGGLYKFNLESTEMALLGSVTTPDRPTTLRRLHNSLGHRNLLRLNKYVKNKTMRVDGWPSNVTDR